MLHSNRVGNCGKVERQTETVLASFIFYISFESGVFYDELTGHLNLSIVYIV